MNSRHRKTLEVIFTGPINVQKLGLDSGKLMLRVSPDIHAAVAVAAEVNGKSIDQWASEVLGKATHI